MPEVEHDAIFQALNLSAAVAAPSANTGQEAAYDAAAFAGMYPGYCANSEMGGSWDSSWSDYDYSWYSAMSQQMAAVAQASMLMQAASLQVPSVQSDSFSLSLPELLPASAGNDAAASVDTAKTVENDNGVRGIIAKSFDALKESSLKDVDGENMAARSGDRSSLITTPLVLTTPCRKNFGVGRDQDDLDFPDVESCDVADAVTWFQMLASNTPAGSPASLESSPGAIGFQDFMPLVNPLPPMTLEGCPITLPQGPPIVLKLSEMVDKDHAARSSPRDAEAAAILQLVQGGQGVAQGAEILRKLKGGHDTPSTVASDGDASGAGKALLRQLKGADETEQYSDEFEKKGRSGRRGGRRRRGGRADGPEQDDAAEELYAAPQKPASVVKDGKPRWQPRVVSALEGAATPTPARRAKNGERRNLG